MVVFKKFTSSEFIGLPQIQARVLYDSTANVLRLHDSQSYNNVVITKDLSNNVSNINSLTATNLTGTLQTASQPNITSVGTLTSLSTGSLTLNGTAITATATDINSISGISTTLEPITSVTAGTAAASKALILDSSRDITNIHSLTATKNINVTRTTNGECFIVSNGTVRSAIHCVTNSAHIGTTTNHNFNIQANGSNVLQCLSSGNVNITSSTASTSTTTGALTISGGLGISGSTNIGGDINLTGSLILNGTTITATAAEINWLDITAAGTAEASKALVLDANRDITNINNLTLTNLIGSNVSLSSANLNNFNTSTTNSTIITPSSFTNQYDIYLRKNLGGNNNTLGIAFHLTTNDVSSTIPNSSIICTRTAVSQGYLSFNTSQVERLRISETGNVNIINHNGSSSGLKLNDILVTATAAELNYNDITAIGTAEASKALVLDASRNIININALTATNLTGTLQTAAQPNITSVGTLTSLSTGSLTLNDILVTATAAELNYNDITTIGTAQASKALIVDANKDIQSIRRLHIDRISIGTLDYTNTNRLISAIDNSITNSTARYIGLGKSYTTYNEAEWGYFHTSDGSTSNRQEFGFFGANGIFAITAGRKVGINNTGPNYDLDVTGDINLTGSIRFSGTAITATAAEINKLSGVTSTTTELNYLDITTIGAGEASKALILDSSRDIANINSLTATNLTGTLQTAAQTNITSVGTLTSLISSGNIVSSNASASFRILPNTDNIIYFQAGLNTTTGSSADIFIGNYLQATSASTRKIMIKADGKVGFGTASPSYTLDVIGDINLTGSIRFSGTAITATAAEINYLDITTAGIAQASKALVLDASKQIKEITKLQIGTNTTIGIGDLNIMNTAANSSIRFGSSESSGNLVTLQWTYVSADSLTNKFSFDFYGRSNQMALYNSGNMSINRASPYAMVDIAGNSNFVSGTYNKILACFGSNASPVQFDIQCSTGTSATSTNAAWIGTVSNNDLRIGTNDSSKMIILANGYVGIGTSTPSYPLHVVSNQTVTYTGGTAFYAYTGSATTTGTNTNPSTVYIFTNGRILASEFNATSDSRIKTNIIDIDDISALNTLRLIQPKKYNYIDTLTRSSNPVWGFIAQQVHSVLDYAVNIETDYIPNIFQTATKTISENGDTILTVTNPITFDSHSTNKLKILSENDKYEYVTIKTKISNTQISINETLEDNNYFIYGEQINNLHVLNKDAIFTITTAAVQEIDRNVTELENKVELLEQKNNQLEQQIQDILTRLQNIENP
jgi:hypothetical protein